MLGAYSRLNKREIEIFAWLPCGFAAQPASSERKEVSYLRPGIQQAKPLKSIRTLVALHAAQLHLQQAGHDRRGGVEPETRLSEGRAMPLVFAADDDQRDQTHHHRTICPGSAAGAGSRQRSRVSQNATSGRTSRSEGTGREHEKTGKRQDHAAPTLFRCPLHSTAGPAQHALFHIPCALAEGARTERMAPDNRSEGTMDIRNAETGSKSRYSTTVAGHEAEVTYSRTPRAARHLDHTGVSEAARREGGRVSPGGPCRGRARKGGMEDHCHALPLLPRPGHAPQGKWHDVVNLSDGKP
ncbi:hypothetical protein FQR65_LT20836 [Abscondita terminalis]|nr:hypothetical protein FQR65_LT20836 [Abscondita terminalis]